MKEVSSKSTSSHNDKYMQVHADDSSTPTLATLFLSSLAHFCLSVNFVFLSLDDAVASSSSRLPLEALERGGDLDL